MRLLALLAITVPITAAVYEVGPGKPLTSIAQVPWSTLNAGDRVDIYWRSTPYKEKWCINRLGTPTAPVVVRGIPGPTGALPVIDGDGAVTVLSQNCWNEDRGVIKIGGGNGPDIPQHIVIEQLEIKNAKSGVSYRSSNGGTWGYNGNAAGVYVERGYGITVRRCAIHDNGNGIFVGSTDSYQARDILIERNHIYGNGYPSSSQYHNAYTSAINITYQYNRMTMPAGVQGTNLKDRSANGIYRYNWIEGGNRQLDLVDAPAAVAAAPGFHDAHAYGNVLVDYNGYDNSQLVHFGGDINLTYHQGTLHFFNNTVVSYRYDEAQLVRISHANARADVRNNIIHAPNGPLRIMSDAGTVNLRNNWLKTGWTAKYVATWPSVLNDLGGNVTGINPGFVNAVASTSADYRLLPGSPCLDRAIENNPVLPASFSVAREYVPATFNRGRLKNGLPDLGALEYTEAVVPRINTLISRPL